MRRSLRRTTGWVLAALAVLLLAWPFLVPVVFGPLLANEWGGPATMGSAQWFFGDTIVLTDVVSLPSAADPAGIEVDRIDLQFERTPLLHDPGRMVAGDFVGGRLSWQGRPVATVERVEFRYDPEHGQRLRIIGLDGEVAVERVADWIGVVRRIVEAPGVAGDGGSDDGDFLRRIQVESSRFAVEVATAGGESQRVQLDEFTSRFHPTAAKAMAIDELTAKVLGGELHTNGSLDWTRDTIEWHAQVNLQRLDLAIAGAQLAWLPESSSGKVSAFVDFGTTDTGLLGGAGWLEGSDIAVWEHPVAKAVVDQIGVQPTRDDLLDEVRAELMIDGGRLYFRKLIAIGSPIDLYGNGSMRLDGQQIEAGFVPRFTAERLEDVPLADDRARDVALDVIKGALVEVKIEGSFDRIEAFVQPLPVLTEPVRQFLKLFR